MRALPLRHIAAVAAVCVFAGGWVEASHTNFTGRWVVDGDKTKTLNPPPTTRADASPATRDGAVVTGGNLIDNSAPAPPSRPTEQRVTQTATTITVERSSPTGRQKHVYKLDGTECVNVNGPSTQKTTSRWDGERLITEGTETTTTKRGTIVNAFREARWLDNDGTMVVESTRQFDGSGKAVTLQGLVKKK